MASTKSYLAIGVAVFAANVVYVEYSTNDRISSVEHAVLAIADDVQSIKEAVLIDQEPAVIKYSKRELDCLTRNIYYEAGVEDRLGKVAVAQVTLNRVKTGYWGKNICKVVYAPSQFSWTKVKRRAWIPNIGPAWEESKQVAAEVLDQGLRIRTLKTSLFYHADYVNPYWKDNSKRVTKVGRHIFYTQAKGSTLKL